MQQTSIVLYNTLSLMIIYIMTVFFFSRLLGISLLILQFKNIIIVNGMYYYCINSKYEIPHLYTYWLM